MLQLIDKYGNVYGEGPIIVTTKDGKLKTNVTASAAWGSITGILSNQTDLQAALNAKQDTLVSGTNIKTINGSSILGSGNLVITGGVSSVSGVAPIASSGGATPSISIATADISTTGALTFTDWNTFNGKQNAITLTTTGTSGPATLVGSTLNIPQYGGGGTIIKLAAQTLLAASWSLSGSYYIYNFSNVNITTNTRVDFTPDNSAYNEISTCGMLPEVDVFAGSCRFYSLFPPQSDILGEITIFPTI